ncbi:TPA: hypothetical protein EYH33_00515 [Candidatus Bipolaricaulota bacterium]|nr:hypothetical protein [Candidatus Bipolaricaulota bacterium]
MCELDLRTGPDGVAVLYGGEVWVRGMRMRLGGDLLEIFEHGEISGQDRLGGFTGRALTCVRDREPIIELSVKLYPARAALLVEALVVEELTGLAGEDSFLASPLDVPLLFLREADYLLFTWGMVGPGGKGEWPHPVHGNTLENLPPDRPFAPLVLAAGRRSLAISPASHLPVSPLRAVKLGGNTAIARGIHGAIDRLPRGSVLRTLLVFGGDPLATLHSLGDILLSLGGKGRPRPTDHPVLSRLGYWTDYGAYYSDLFHPADEQTLLELGRHFRSRKLPVGYFGLDLWYEYERAGLATAYRPDPGKFPRGLGPIAHQTGIPMFLHLSGFARENVYRDRYRFLEGEEAACPAEPRFYRDLARELKGQGAIGVWHDHLRNQQGRVPVLRASLTAAEDWFAAMTSAFEEAGLPLLLSVPTMGFLLAATQAPGVIAARSGEDYLVRQEQQLAMLPPKVRKKYELVPYREFIRGRFLMGWLLWALGMYPFHDVFITNASHPEGFCEPRARDEALMRALSCGPVGIGDKLGCVDRGIVERLCFSDGTLAKPDRPAQPLWRPLFQGLLAAAAETTLEPWTWRFLAVYNITEGEQAYSLDPADLGAEGAVVYDYFRRRLASGVAGGLPPEGGDYFILAPLVEGIALLGLLDKYITLPAGRCRLERGPEGLLVMFSTPPGGEHLVGAVSEAGLAVEAQGAELRGVWREGALHLIRVRPQSPRWRLSFRTR